MCCGKRVHNGYIFSVVGTRVECANRKLQTTIRLNQESEPSAAEHFHGDLLPTHKRLRPLICGPLPRVDRPLVWHQGSRLGHVVVMVWNARLQTALLVQCV